VDCALGVKNGVVSRSLQRCQLIPTERALGSRLPHPRWPWPTGSPDWPIECSSTVSARMIKALDITKADIADNGSSSSVRKQPNEASRSHWRTAEEVSVHTPLSNRADFRTSECDFAVAQQRFSHGGGSSMMHALELELMTVRVSLKRAGVMSAQRKRDQEPHSILL
jgi:hypothetical protein